MKKLKFQVQFKVTRYRFYSARLVLLSRKNGLKDYMTLYVLIEAPGLTASLAIANHVHTLL